MLGSLMLLVGLTARLSSGVMQGGQELGPDVFLNSVFIQKNADPFEFVCLGTVFNSFTVFTSDICDLDPSTPNNYRIMPASATLGKDFDVKKAKAFEVIHIEALNASQFVKNFQSKIVRIDLPGMLMSIEAMSYPFTDDWTDFLEVVETNSTPFIGAVMSSELPKPKGAAVIFKGSNLKECNDTYTKMAPQNPDWPKDMQLEHFCIFQGTDEFNTSFGVSIKPGMPCDDSKGSPIFGLTKLLDRVVIGILLLSKCDSDPKFAIGLGAPEFLVDTVYTPTPPTTPSTTETVTPGPTPGPRPQPSSPVPDVNAATALDVHLPFWSSAIFSFAYLGSLRQ